MAEILFKIFSPLAAASVWVVITAQSAPTGVVRSQVVRHGAVIRRVLSVQESPCHSCPRAAGSAGEWPATTAAPAKAGASTQLSSFCAHRFRSVHRRLLIPVRRRHQGRDLRSAKSSRYARVYSGTSASPRELNRLGVPKDLVASHSRK